MITVTSREFNQNVSGAKKAADQDVVFITDRGKPSHVLMSIEEYERLRGGGTLYDALAMPDADAIDFEPPRANIVAHVPDLS